ncbi:hypothetical protein PtB15_12B42 [Puccinia triticina]|nr:hypothetical protein PtB15_12B42 [Puccinia triticina]
MIHMEPPSKPEGAPRRVIHNRQSQPGSPTYPTSRLSSSHPLKACPGDPGALKPSQR